MKVVEKTIEERKLEEPETVEEFFSDSNEPISQNIPTFNPQESVEMRRKRAIAAAEQRRLASSLTESQ